MHSGSRLGVQFRESLPCGCPPDDADLKERLVGMRMSKRESPSSDCFDSKAHMSLPQGDTDPCDFASCSYFQVPDGLDFKKAIEKLPKFKRFYTHVFFTDIGPECGRYNINRKSRHINVWFYAAYKPEENVKATELI